MYTGCGGVLALGIKNSYLPLVNGCKITVSQQHWGTLPWREAVAAQTMSCNETDRTYI